MSKLFNSLEDEELEDSQEAADSETQYPIMLKVDGYDVNHYYDGDVPVYEVYDKDGSIIETAHSTAEMHEITGSAKP